MLFNTFLFIGTIIYTVSARSIRPYNPISHLSLLDISDKEDSSSNVNNEITFEYTSPLNITDLITLRLQKINLFHPDAVVEYADRIEPLTHSGVYKGIVYIHHGTFQREAGWARILRSEVIEGTFEGSFSIDGLIYHVKPFYKYSLLKQDYDVSYCHQYPGSSIHEHSMIVYRDAHSLHNDLSHLIKRQSIDTGGAGGQTLSQQQLIDSLGQTTGCPTSDTLAYVGAAADCTYNALFGNESTTREHVISVFNQASQIYDSTFKIALGLRNLIVSAPDCPGTANQAAPWNIACAGQTIDDRLSIFSQWRGTKQGDGIALWSLLTTCGTGSEVGVAWLGALCQDNAQAQGSQTVAGTNVVTTGNDEWKILAHEIGHGFGAVHDCTSFTCGGSSTSTSTCCPLSATACDANSQYIMNPDTLEKLNQFSPCSIGNICSGLARGTTIDGSCLVPNNGSVSLITEQECGNGIVESGEECDCGGAAGCGSNNCCDPSTCKFINNAVCDDSNMDCCQNCQLAAANTTCRQGTGECDPAEVCTGTSPSCPIDIFAQNGKSCGGDNSGLQCAAGICTSRDQQCRQLLNGTNGACNLGGAADCAVTCASSTDFNTCLYLTQNFLDGTPCGYSGYCKQGVCSSGNGLGNQVRTWFQRNKTLAIVIGSVLGVILLLAIASCLNGCFGRRRYNPNQKRPFMGRRFNQNNNNSSVPLQNYGGQPYTGYQQPIGGTNGHWNAPPPQAYRAPVYAPQDNNPFRSEGEERHQPNRLSRGLSGRAPDYTPLPSASDQQDNGRQQRYMFA